MSDSPVGPVGDPEPAPVKAKQANGAYMVLSQQEKPSPNSATTMPTGGWNIVGESITARSSEHAIRIYAEHATGVLKDKELTLVAIPARSWRPVKVSTETTTRLVIEGEAS